MLNAVANSEILRGYIMKKLRVDSTTYSFLEQRAIQKGLSVTDYVSSLLPKDM